MKKIHGVFCVAVLLIAAMVTFIGCGSPGDGSSDDSLTGGAFGKAKYAIGDTGPGGGIIFYYNKQGFTVGTVMDGVYNGETYHYLEAAPADIGTTPKSSGKGILLAWSSGGIYDDYHIPGPWMNGIGLGYAFTEAILAVDTAAPAALACRNATYGGKTDWFLPNHNELERMYKNRATIGGFANARYWSSTQSNSDDYRSNGWSAFTSDFGGNYIYGSYVNLYKWKTYYVRAIRAL
ncbi:hypothetical protein AGMMS49579_02840 [Spirochaetia bacterium]|nr:hypothetical protein AGMMS49579_02840 [Spirochaetia bacterium]